MIASKEELWPCVFGAGVELGGYTEVSFLKGDWDEPGVANVLFIADDFEEVGDGDVNLDLLWDAYQKACAEGLRDYCMGTPLAEVTEENFDVCCADVVLQIAVLGKVELS